MGRIVAVSCIVVTVVAGVLAAEAGAQTEAIIAVSDATPNLGEVITVDGEGFGPPVSEVRVLLGDSVAAVVSPGESGAFTLRVTVPATSGAQQIVASGVTEEGTEAARAETTVDVGGSAAPPSTEAPGASGATDDAGTLAFTGPHDGLLLAAGFLLMLGAALTTSPVAQELLATHRERHFRLGKAVARWTNDDILPRRPYWRRLRPSRW